MLPKLSDVLLAQLQELVQVCGRPVVIVDKDESGKLGTLELKLGWSSPEVEASYKDLAQRYVEALGMEAMLTGGK